MFLKIRILAYTSLILLLLYGCWGNKHSETEETTTAPADVTPVINYAVIKTLPHDTLLFTEGFLFHKGQLFESTGSPDNLPKLRSMIGITNLATGNFDKKIEIDGKKYFGEGIVFIKNKLYQLTYQSQKGFIYDANSYKQIGEFTFKNNEGWGLTTDGKSLIMSDGTDSLTYLNPDKLNVEHILKVTENNIPLRDVNELEYINGYIYANIWKKDFIVKINPASGKVQGKIDLSSLTSEAKTKRPGADVLNGIAYDSVNDKIYVTGKLWANIYQINFKH
jgi:glutamine cyclotransferase